MNILEYINLNFSKTIRNNPVNTDTMIGLPYPYTVPCCEGHFQELYYWDTYFTNSGLLQAGQVGQARNNIDNMCFFN